MATANLADIAILYVIGDAISGYEIDIEEDAFLTIRVYFPETNNRMLKAIRQFRAQLKGYKMLLQQFGKPDIVHVHSLYPAAIFALYLDFFKNIPFLITEHYSGYMQQGKFKKEKLRKLFTQFAFRHAQVVFGLSDFFIETLKLNGLKARKFKVVFNVVDTELYKPKKGKIKTTIYTFINLSLFNDYKKNITGIIRSAAQLAQKRQDFVVNLVGKGEHQERIEQCARDLGVLNRFVFFKGYVSQNEGAFLMQESDCVIMFSNIESQSVVTLEAASVGLPIIATETGGIGERVTPETGVLLDIGDEAGLVEAMNYVMDNREKYEPAVIRSKIIDRCSIEAVGKAIVSGYEEVLNK